VPISPNFTNNDLLEEIRAAIPQMGDDFMTTAEIAKELGISPKTTRAKLHEILDRLIPGKKQIVTMSGVKTFVPAYKIKKEIENDQETTAL